MEREGELEPLDAWLRRGLVERFAPVLQEALPSEWLKLLGRPQA